MAIFYFKHSYLNWRVIPCRRRMICVFVAFSSFSQHFFSWFSFRLSRIFQVHDMTINFSFVFFLLFFTICLLRATMHAIDGLPSWNISSHVRICFEKVGFWFEVARITSIQRKIGLKSIPEKWAIFDHCALRYQSRWFQSITILGLVFLVIERVLASLKL